MFLGCVERSLKNLGQTPKNALSRAFLLYLSQRLFIQGDC